MFLKEQSNKLLEITFYFQHCVKPRFHLFDKTVKKLEGNDKSAVEVSMEFYKLLANYENRLACKYIPFMADNLFKKLEAEALLDREHVVSVVVRFYRTIISY